MISLCMQHMHGQNSTTITRNVNFLGLTHFISAKTYVRKNPLDVYVEFYIMIQLFELMLLPSFPLIS
jgi:hypothetical protein